MMKTLINFLCETKPPWFYTTNCDASQLTNIAFEINRKHMNRLSARVLRGNKMDSVNGLFNEFAAALQFPYYFGANWNAFDECIADLDWLNAHGYCLIILNADQVLGKAEDVTRERKSLFRTLYSAAEEWAKAVKNGEPWDRPSRPFHVVFHTNADKSNSFRLAVEEAGWTLAELPSPG